MSEDYGEEARTATPLERAASRGRIGGGGLIGHGNKLQKEPGVPEGPFRLWQRAFNDELAALGKTIEDLESQLTPYLMPQTEADHLSKAEEASAPQSELVGWMESSAMVVKLLRAHVSRLTQRLEL